MKLGRIHEIQNGRKTIRSKVTQKNAIVIGCEQASKMRTIRSKNAFMSSKALVFHKHSDVAEFSTASLLV